MDRPLLGGAIKRTPQRLAIYRHHPAHCGRKPLHPGDETTLKLLRVQPRKHVPQLVVRRDPYDIPEPLEKDDVFVDIVDHPSYYGCLRQFTGAQPMFLAEQVRTVPPWPLSYTNWHPDVPHSNPLHIKVQIYVNDVAPGCGEFAFVPASHMREAGPYTRPVFQESMPGHRTFVGAAGTAVMFNAYGWHAAMDNRSGIPRKSIILIYEQRTAGRVDPDTFSAIAHRCTTSERRRLFSLEQ